MPLLYVLLIIFLLGLLVTLMYVYVPDNWLLPVIKKLIVGIYVVGVIIWLITLVAPGLTGVRVGH